MVEEARGAAGAVRRRVSLRRRRSRPAARRSGGPVDAILSTATFHWVPDHDALFRNLAAVLRPGGRLVAQCGGAGNIASIRAVLADGRRRLAGRRPLRDARGDRRRRLAAAGFVDIEMLAAADEPTPFEPGAPFETFLRTVVLGSHVARLPEAERDAFVHEVAWRLPASPDRLRPAEHPRRPGAA